MASALTSNCPPTHQHTPSGFLCKYHGAREHKPFPFPFSQTDGIVTGTRCCFQRNLEQKDRGEQTADKFTVHLHSTFHIPMSSTGREIFISRLVSMPMNFGSHLPLIDTWPSSTKLLVPRRTLKYSCWSGVGGSALCRKWDLCNDDDDGNKFNYFGVCV